MYIFFSVCVWRFVGVLNLISLFFCFVWFFWLLCVSFMVWGGGLNWLISFFFPQSKGNLTVDHKTKELVSCPPQFQNWENSMSRNTVSCIKM